MAGIGGVGGATRVVVSDARDYDAQIARLQRQERLLTKQLRDVAASDADATAKLSQQALLRAKIQLIEAEITRLRQAQAEEQRSKVDPGPVTALSIERTDRNVIEEYSAGAVDLAL